MFQPAAMGTFVVGVGAHLRTDARKRQKDRQCSSFSAGHCQSCDVGSERKRTTKSKQGSLSRVSWRALIQPNCDLSRLKQCAPVNRDLSHHSLTASSVLLSLGPLRASLAWRMARSSAMGPSRFECKRS